MVDNGNWLRWQLLQVWTQILFFLAPLHFSPATAWGWGGMGEIQAKGLSVPASLFWGVTHPLRSWASCLLLLRHRWYHPGLPLLHSYALCSSLSGTPSGPLSQHVVPLSSISCALLGVCGALWGPSAWLFASIFAQSIIHVQCCLLRVSLEACISLGCQALALLL